MAAYRTHPHPPRVDFHMALLWLRSMEIVVGHSPSLVAAELERDDLFSRYRSPWRA